VVGIEGCPISRVRLLLAWANAGASWGTVGAVTAFDKGVMVIIPPFGANRPVEGGILTG
jgi:hypothetical protein